MPCGEVIAERQKEYAGLGQKLTLIAFAQGLKGVMLVSYERARSRTNAEMNKLYPGDQAIHGWYRFVLSFPPHLVRDYVRQFGLSSSHCVLDPFCGTGTT